MAKEKRKLKYAISILHMVKTGFYIPDVEKYSIKCLLKHLWKA
jgi:hypothetical protein